MNRKITIDYRMHLSSGIGTYLSNLIPKIALLTPFIEYVLLVPKKDLETLKSKFEPLKNISFRVVEAPIFSLQEQYSLPRAIPKDTNLFWTPNFNIPIAWTGPLVVTLCDAFYLAQPLSRSNWITKLYAGTAFRIIKRRATHILTISNFSKGEIVKRAGFRTTEIEVVYCGVDSAFFVPQDIKIEHTPFFICVGNIKPHKNLRTVIEGFRQVLDKLPHKLVIVGNYEGLRTKDSGLLLDAITQLGNRVKFTGLISNQLLCNYYSRAEALIFPSLYEGFGLPPLEAMSCGTPCIVSDRASIPEVCGEAALYINPDNPKEIADQMIKVATDQNLRTDLIQRGYSQIKKFSWDDAANKTTDRLIKILEGLT